MTPVRETPDQVPDIARFLRFLPKTLINFRPISRRKLRRSLKSRRKGTTYFARDLEDRSHFRDALAAGS